MAANNHKRFNPNRKVSAVKKTFRLPEPKDNGLIKFMIRRLGEMKATKGRVHLFVDRNTNTVSISGNNNEVSEGEIIATRLIEEYKNGQIKKTNSTEGKRKVEIPQNTMGYVIGKNGCNLQRVRHETGATINLCECQIFVSGTDKQCKDAIKKLKSNACDGLYQCLIKKHFTCRTFDYVDGTGSTPCYMLELIDCPKTYWRQEENYFKISMVDEDESEKDYYYGEIQMDDLKNIMRKVLEQIQKPTKDMLSDNDSGDNDDVLFPKSDFWLHFGHIFITGDVDEADQGNQFSLTDFQANLNQKPGWKMLFDSAIKEMEVTALEEALSGNVDHNIPPHTRYDITFITPSCKKIRVKIFLDSSGKPTKDFLDNFVDIQPDEQCTTVPYLLCDYFYHRAKISIAIPSRSMDVRMNIRTLSSSLTKTDQEIEEELNEERILKTFLDRIKIEDGEVKLPNDVPQDFCLLYFRRCARRSYCYDDGPESFTIVISEEQEIDPDNDGEQFDAKTDIHINSDAINHLLRSGKWEPDDIIAKLPTFLNVVRNIQHNISATDHKVE